MSVIINDNMSVATIKNDFEANQVSFEVDSTINYKMGYDMGMEKPIYDDGMNLEAQKQSIFANTIFLVILTVVVLLAGAGAGLLIAKSKIKKGLDYDENY